MEKLRSELPGILQWSLIGCLSWQREGLNPPVEVQDATESYRQESDALLHFIDDNCTINPLARSKAAELYQCYFKWTQATGEYPMNQRRFGQSLSERGFRKVKSNSVNWWTGIGLAAGAELYQEATQLARVIPRSQKVI